MGRLKRVIATVIRLTIVIGLLSVIPAYSVNAADDDYIPIYDIEDLININNNPDGNYRLMNDIDMSKDTSPGGRYAGTNGWTTLKRFSGIFDGNGHRIEGMHIYGNFNNDNGNIGLFESVGLVKNLGMTDVNIDVKYDDEDDRGCSLGAISGDEGKFENCYVTGTIRANVDSAFVGGIVGCEYIGDYMKNCYSTADISVSYIGGGTRTIEVGGLTARAEYMNDCYCTGNINISDSFIYVGPMYCSILSGDNNFYISNRISGGELPLEKHMNYCKSISTNMMKVKGSFSGYDFDEIWVMDPYSTYNYPQLRDNMQVKITSSRLISSPTHTTYYTTDKVLNPAGGKASLTWENGTSKVVNFDKKMFSGYDLSKMGKQTVKVGIVNQTFSFGITVKKKVTPKLSLAHNGFVYNGKNVKPTVTVRDGNIRMSGSDYSVSYPDDSKTVGLHKITVNLKGLYEGSNTIEYAIFPQKTSISSMKTGGGAFQVKWKKVSKEVSGYEIEYSTTKNFKKGVKTIKIKNKATTSKVIKNLKIRKKYYVRIRTYKKVKGDFFLSDWSKVRSITVR